MGARANLKPSIKGSKRWLFKILLTAPSKKIAATTSKLRLTNSERTDLAFRNFVMSSVIWDARTRVRLRIDAKGVANCLRKRPPLCLKSARGVGLVLSLRFDL